MGSHMGGNTGAIWYRLDCCSLNAISSRFITGHTAFESHLTLMGWEDVIKSLVYVHEDAVRVSGLIAPGRREVNC